MFCIQFSDQRSQSTKSIGSDQMPIKKDELQKEGLTTLLESAIPRWRGRADSEHEQAIIRLIIGTIASIYLIYVIITQGRNIFSDAAFYTILAFFFGAGIIVTWLYISPEISPPRRLFGAVIDITGSTVVLYLHGNLAAPLFIVYLWVTFGNGFRFGKKYLYFSMTLSIIGYGWVIWTSPNWSISPQLTYGLFVGLVLLPMYVAALLGRLTRTMNRLEKANNAKSTFLATMSHEIRTPLSGILGLISLFKKTGLNDSQSHYLQLIEKSSDWLHRVISDGLDFSKMEADELIIDLSPFSLQQALNDLVSFYKGVAAVKGIQLQSSIDPTLPICVAGDRSKLIQVLNNLLANACKFTERGEVGLLVEVVSANDTGVTVTFTISDTGVGITKEEMHHIFQPFRQADSSTARKFGGTGLGLAIADRIVRLMGGTIAVDSRKDKGTIFHFTLAFPLAVFLSETDSYETAGDRPPLWLRPPRVLLVEDHEINQEVLQQLFEVAGCVVSVATDGQQAIELSSRERWDLIFMDCQMPVVDGYEATRQIRVNKSSLNSATPIIALTAHVTVADKNRCLAAGMSDYLGKPCTLADITLMLKKWLNTLLGEDSQPDTTSQLTGNKAAEEVVEQTLKKTERRQELHHLRNYFTKIIGSAELALLKFDSSEEVRKYLEMILQESRKESDRLKNLDEN